MHLPGWIGTCVFMILVLKSTLIFGIDWLVFSIGDERKTPSDSNSPSSSSLSTLSDSVNSKDEAELIPKSKGSTNLLVISVVPGSQTLLNAEEKSEKGKHWCHGCTPTSSPSPRLWGVTVGTSACDFLLQVLNVFSVTLSAKQKTCLSAICKSTWLQGCLNVMCATSSWRLLSNYWSTRNATLSPPVGSSKESKYTNFYCVKYLKYCGGRNKDINLNGIHFCPEKPDPRRFTLFLTFMTLAELWCSVAKWKQYYSIAEMPCVPSGCSSLFWMPVLTGSHHHNEITVNCKKKNE